MRQWHYEQMGQPCGPVDENELVGLIQRGQLDEDALVWTEGMADWVAARMAPDLLPGLDGASVMQPEPETTGRQIRPWVRLWARMVDLYLFSICADLVLTYVHKPAHPMAPVPYAMVVLFCYALFEAVLLAQFGTTPGKALLRVRVRLADGGTPTLGAAEARSLSLWGRGMGFGLPVVSLITVLFGYYRLTSRGITAWDENAGFVVTHRTIGWRRVLVAALFLSLMGGTKLLIWAHG